MESRERYDKTEYLTKTWIKEQGIDIQLENIAHSIKYLIRGIYHKLPDNKIEELYEAVSNNMESKDD
jgi:NMD protein affecting ribosome stability and mRNA decay